MKVKIIQAKSRRQDPPPCCDICSELLGVPRWDGEVESAAILPCSHVFGSLCISQWLEKDSLHQDCPLCRRRMIYRECGHIIKSCDLAQAPKCVREQDMPKKCLACRGGGREELRLRREKRRASEERSLSGLSIKMHLPRVFGGLYRNGTEWSVDEFRRDWRAEVDAIFGDFEHDRRNQW